MADPITTTFVFSSILKLKDELKTVFKASKDEIKFLIDDGLLSYAASQKEKFETLNTFLYRHDRVPFYDTYFSLNLKGIKPNRDEYSIGIEKQPKKIFENSSCVTIIGDAGSGKSMLMKHIFLHFITKEAEIPLFIELRNLNSFEGSFVDYINSTIFNNRLSPNNRILERLLRDGKFIFLLDGYDELHDSNVLRRKDEINSFIDKYRANYFVITSRKGTYIEELPRFQNLYVESIPSDKIELFIDKQLTIYEDKGDYKKKLLEVIADPKNMDYSEYMTNPLLLTMFIFTFRDHPEMPHSKNGFYYNVFETLCTRHDNFSKGGDIHERKTKLKAEDFKDILQWFSYKSFFAEQFNFDRQYLVTTLTKIKKEKGLNIDIDDLIYDLTVSIGILLIDGSDYKFPHRSLQEYFCAVLISKQSEEKRMKIYNNTLPISSSLDNLFVLFTELDPIIFTRFSLEKLKLFYTFVYIKSTKQAIFNYFNLMRFHLTKDFPLIKANNEKLYSYILSGHNCSTIQSQAPIYIKVALLNGINIFDITILAGIIGNPVINEKIKKMDSEYLIIEGKQIDFLYKHSNKTELKNRMNNLLENTKAKINHYESFLEKAERESIALLDLD